MQIGFVEQVFEIQRQESPLQPAIGLIQRIENPHGEQRIRFGRPRQCQTPRNPYFPLMDDSHARERIEQIVNPILLASGNVGLKFLMEKPHAFRRQSLQMGKDRDPMCFLQVGRRSHPKFRAQHIRHFTNHISLFCLVDDACDSGYDAGRAQEPFTVMVQIPDIRQRLSLRLATHTLTHLKSRTVGEGGAQHAVRRNTTPEYPQNSLRQHFRLARSRWRQDQMAPFINLDNGSLFFCQIHAPSPFPERVGRSSGEPISGDRRIKA